MTAFQRKKLMALLTLIGQCLIGLAKGIIEFFRVAIGLLFENSKPTPSEDDDEYPTGIYNLRTGKFDNGSDPYGWYEDDR